MPLLGRKNVDSAIDDLYTKTNDNLRGVFLSGLTNIVQETPVDEGRARNNWFYLYQLHLAQQQQARLKGWALYVNCEQCLNEF